MNRCILVFGMPRSGTTWIGKLFDSHPDTLYRHEPDSVRWLSLPLFPDKQDAPQYREELERFVAALPRIRSVKVAGKQPLFSKRYHSTATLCVYRASVTVAKFLGHFKTNVPLPYRPTGQSYKQACLVWKSIESPGRLGVCMEALPQARAIHILRHPCGYVASVQRGEAAARFGDLIPSSEDYEFLGILLATPGAKSRKLTLGDMKQLTPEERLAWCWVLIQEKMLADIEKSNRAFTVRYEDVCAKPAVLTRQMFEFVGLDWQTQTEKFIRSSTRAGDTDYYSVFKHSQASAERWRSELAPQVIERILRILRTSRLHRFYADGVQAPLALPETAV